MKAKIISTGEILKIAEHATIAMDVCDDYGNPLQISPEDIELIHEDTTSKNNIDWEQRRFEIAKDALQGMLINPKFLDLADAGIKVMKKLGKESEPADFYVGLAISFADTLIRQLKNDKI